MAFQGVMRLGQVQLRVMDLGEAATHYEDVIGLIRTGEDDGRIYLKAWDENDHHSVVLREADRPGLDFAGFKVTDNDTLKSLEKKLVDAGIEVEHIPAGEQLAMGERIRFVVPTGHHIELYAEMDAVGNGLGDENPEVWPDGLKGIHPPRLDHLAVTGDDLDGSVKIFRDILGFSISEEVMAPDNDQLMIGAFMTANNGVHDIAFLRGEGKDNFHHCAFWLDSWMEIEKAADLLTKRRKNIDLGPTKHGISRGGTIYFFDPSGNRNETFTGGYIYYPDNPVITWKGDEVTRGLFYYERTLKENFINVTT